MVQTWRVAPSLDELLRQVNVAAPRRDTASDGAIGNASHQARDSDHNPWYFQGDQHWVTARDFTHDPAGGLDCERLRSALVHVKDHRIKYVIFNKIIHNSTPVLRGGRVQPAWTALPYLGDNTHEHHLHLSVLPDPISLQPYAWLLPGVFEEDNVNPADVWGYPVHNLYTGDDPNDVMSAGVALEWSMARASQAKETAEVALSTVQRIEARQLATFNLVQEIADKFGVAQ